MVSPYLPWSKHGKHVLKTGDAHPPLGIQKTCCKDSQCLMDDHHSSHVAWPWEIPAWQARSTARLEIPLAGCRRCWFCPCLPVHAGYSQAARQAAGHVSSFPWLTLTSLAQRVESGYLWICASHSSLNFDVSHSRVVQNRPCLHRPSVPVTGVISCYIPTFAGHIHEITPAALNV